VTRVTETSRTKSRRLGRRSSGRGDGNYPRKETVSTSTAPALAGVGQKARRCHQYGHRRIFHFCVDENPRDRHLGRMNSRFNVASVPAVATPTARLSSGRQRNELGGSRLADLRCRPRRSASCVISSAYSHGQRRLPGRDKVVRALDANGTEQLHTATGRPRQGHLPTAGLGASRSGRAGEIRSWGHSFTPPTRCS
jgi:hypothetical protein